MVRDDAAVDARIALAACFRSGHSRTYAHARAHARTHARTHMRETMLL